MQGPSGALHWLPTMSTRKSGIPTLLELHKPRRVARTALVVPFKESSRQCLKRLAEYEPPATPPYPRSQSAAVLVALFVGRWGDIYVLLSRRSASLSSYAGDTALPGGRVDKEDATLEETARREAFEEIGLPRDKRRVPLLCILPPFLARSHLIVTPVVVLITDPTLRVGDLSSIRSNELTLLSQSSMHPRLIPSSPIR